METYIMCCRNGEYIIEHDGREWKPEELKGHIRNNNHHHVHISWVALDITKYSEMQRIADGIEAIFANSPSQNKRARNSK